MTRREAERLVDLIEEVIDYDHDRRSDREWTWENPRKRMVDFLVATILTSGSNDSDEMGSEPGI